MENKTISVIAIISLIISIISGIYLHNYIESQHVYKIGIIEVNNTNHILQNVEDYICDSNVYVDNFFYIYKFDGEIYVSTWDDGRIPNSNGTCAIKVRVK